MDSKPIDGKPIDDEYPYDDKLYGTRLNDYGLDDQLNEILYYENQYAYIAEREILNFYKKLAMIILIIFMLIYIFTLLFVTY
jgi:hypothetical protein